jgi:REP element-mobilizing transposase RayT
MQQPLKHTIKTDNAYFLTLTIVGWVDVFTRKNHRDAIIESLKYCQKEKGLLIFAYCIMSNHIHMVANTEAHFELEDVMRDFKKFTSKKILQQIINEPESRRDWMLKIFEEEAEKSKKHKSYKFWKVGSHAIELFSEKFVSQKINYIHENPVKAGLVKSAEEWIYSSASNYHDLESVLEVVKSGLLGRISNPA